MHIILTHEQSDFDALASLLGAYLLDETCIPVLPRKMNRNVRAFITLYGEDLPFIDPRDLSGDPVEAVTLVDTQSLISVKGMSNRTEVFVIDHHPLREDIPREWSITVSGTGANTTFFVETVRDRDIRITTLQATLLLLGIYEDTGSLTYDRTTARDLRAAGYLIEQGASLQIATNFINHPLSKSQQILYDRLRRDAENFNIHGNTVIVACGNAEDMDEELSTIAHKLRDLLDPDALFLLITTRGGVQLIARSNRENIDVAKITSHFGGGGHERAAAGLIKDRELKNVRNELVRILPDYIQPAITVSQIMSLGPQVLSPDTPVDQIAERMQRFGHEGYPVVKGNELVGLVTRRAVDRAQSHKLNLSAESLMEAGEYTVQPDDSIEHLQRLMTECGWGQIPVVDPENGEIIGIVTRTDLIKTLAPRAKVPGRHNIADRLELALPPARLAFIKAVAHTAFEQNKAIYIVGGFVRDLMLERPSIDFDLVVEGDAIELAHALAAEYGGRVTSHSQFGTAKWLIAEIHPKLVNTLIDRWDLDSVDSGDLPGSLDLVTARTEFYTYPTALPTVERGSIKLDLHRRDFTINTLALRLDGRHYGELHDYWGGLSDLRQGIVRVLHSLSFVDDPTRILRAVRFEQRFGFRIDKRTLELLMEAVRLLERVSGDRIRHEINHILAESHASRMLTRLDELELLPAIHPGLFWDDWLYSRIELLANIEPEDVWKISDKWKSNQLKVHIAYIFWMLRLKLGQARSITKRLKLSADLSRIIFAAINLWNDLPSLEEVTPSKVVRRLDEVPPLTLFTVYLACDVTDLREIIYKYASIWRGISPVIDGHDLRTRGLPPGPIYRKILESLRDAWLDEKIVNEEQENQLLETLLSDHFS